MRPRSPTTHAKVPILLVLSVGQDDAVTTRQEYLIDVPEGDREAEEAACQEVLELLAPALRRATVDAFSDYPDPGLQATQGFEDLRRRADNPENAMAVPLDLSDPAQRKTLSQVAAWTIHAEVFGSDGELATFHDCGSGITAYLSAEEARTLIEHLGRFDRVQVVTLEEWRQSKKAARHRRLAGFFRRRR